MTRALYDTAVFIYARGRDHPYREPCRALVAAARDGAVSAEVSVEAVQEYVHVLVRRGGNRADAERAGRDVAGMCAVHGFEAEDLDLVLRLVGDGTDPRDAVHAATAMRRGIGAIVSSDRAFDGIAGLNRLDPMDALQILLSAAP